MLIRPALRRVVGPVSAITLLIVFLVLSNHRSMQHLVRRDRYSRYKLAVYYCSWNIYEQKHYPEDIPGIEHLSHIIYAFAKVDEHSGKIVLSDNYADVEYFKPDMHFDPDIKLPLKGNLHYLLRLKQKYRHLKVLLSVGGWTFSSFFVKGLATPEKRAAFIQSAVDMVMQLGFDGIDIDWEYPRTLEESANLVDVVRGIRIRFDDIARSLNLPQDQFETTIAVSGAWNNYKAMNVAKLEPYLTFYNVMTYDFSGEWASKAFFHSNLFTGELSADRAMSELVQMAAVPRKLVIGLPAYGRVFTGTNGLSNAFEGTGPILTGEGGLVNYKNLPLPNTNEFVDKHAVAASCYDRKKRALVVYDNNETVARKAHYVKERGFGGGFFWESNGDLPYSDSRSLIKAFAETIGLENIDPKPNCITYPWSPYDNLRLGRSFLTGPVAESTNTTAFSSYYNSHPNDSKLADARQHKVAHNARPQDGDTHVKNPNIKEQPVVKPYIAPQELSAVATEQLAKPDIVSADNHQRPSKHLDGKGLDKASFYDETPFQPPYQQLDLENVEYFYAGDRLHLFLYFGSEQNKKDASNAYYPIVIVDK